MNPKYITWISLITLAAGIVLHTSMLTRAQEDHLALINREVAQEEERIRILTAEWHSLKAPERLEALAQRHLKGYGTIKPAQLVSLGDVPERLAVPETTAIAAAAPAVTVSKPVQVATTAAAAKPAPRVQAQAKPVAVAPKPIAVAAAKRPVAAPAPAKDEMAALIESHNQPRPIQVAAVTDDRSGIRALIESQPASRGMLWANLGEGR